MGTTSRNLWHLGVVNLVRARASASISVQPAALLTIEPPRADMLLLLRRGPPPWDDGDARVLRRLWPLLAEDTLLEYKSPYASAYGRGDLLRLHGYGVQYHVDQIERLTTRRALTLVLVVASVTPTLLEDIARMDWTLTPLGGGYHRIDGPVYATYLVVIDEVTEAEDDDVLAIFSHRRELSPAAQRWMVQWIEQERGMQRLEDMEGYEEMMRKFLDSLPVELRLAGLTPSERLVGLAPEERLVDLPPERQVLAFSDEVLRILPDDYLRTLPADVKAAIRARIGRP